MPSKRKASDRNIQFGDIRSIQATCRDLDYENTYLGNQLEICRGQLREQKRIIEELRFTANQYMNAYNITRSQLRTAMNTIQTQMPVSPPPRKRQRKR